LHKDSNLIRILIMVGRILELISRIHLDWTRWVARGLAPHGVSPKQIFLLRKLKEAGGLTPSEVAVLLHGDRPSATSMLDTLERLGWVTRRRDPANGKRVLVQLSEAGRVKLGSVPERLWRSGKTGFDPEACLTQEEQAELARLLGKIHQGLQERS